MTKSYNVVINSEKALNSGSNRGSLNYYIDWNSFLKDDGPYLMTVNFTSSSQIFQGNYTYVLTMDGLSSNSYEIGTGGNPSTQIIASLKYGASLGTQQLNYLTSVTNSNPPIYLINRPSLSTFNIQIRNSINNALFYDDAIAGAGTATLSGTTITIVTQTSGVIIIGTVITLGGIQYTVTNYGTGNGGTGTYIVNTSGTVGTAAAYTTSARNQLGPYILSLSFEKV